MRRHSNWVRTRITTTVPNTNPAWIHLRRASRALMSLATESVAVPPSPASWKLAVNQWDAGLSGQ